MNVRRELRLLGAGCGLLLGLAALTPAASAPPAAAAPSAGARTLPPLPDHLPAWMNSKKGDRVFAKRGSFNFKIYSIPKLAVDLNAVAVGHAMAYEDLVTGHAASLETKTFDRINSVLNHP